jgi:hypothetical protein
VMMFRNDTTFLQEKLSQRDPFATEKFSREFLADLLLGQLAPVELLHKRLHDSIKT